MNSFIRIMHINDVDLNNISYIAIIHSYNNPTHVLFLQRPPSSSLSGYGGLGNDEARSPSSGGGTPGLLQPGSHISGDNISEAGKNDKTFFTKYILKHLDKPYISFCYTQFLSYLIHGKEKKNLQVYSPA